MATSTRRAHNCMWCGRQVADSGMGRRRQYCRQSCRQRAYEQRTVVRGSSIPTDAVVLSAQEVTALADRAFEVRCAAEDIAIALEEGASLPELTALAADLVRLARDAERLR